MNARLWTLALGVLTLSAAQAQTPSPPIPANHPSAATSAPVHWVGRFAGVTTDVPPAPWRVVRLSDRVPPTRYRVREWDGVAAVEAEAMASMALLARPLEVDLHFVAREAPCQFP
ncbi:MAG TPA: hypothetical protein VNJ47_09745 [Nevskiales bacterium]|nr:hypothetical protein [Nevskiales bacterium]